MSNYRDVQLNELSRMRNSIKAFRIVSVNENGLEIELPEGKILSMRPKDFETTPYAVGKFVDVVWLPNYCSGHLTSYSANLLGLTPEAFVPSDGIAMVE